MTKEEREVEEVLKLKRLIHDCFGEIASDMPANLLAKYLRKEGYRKSSAQSVVWPAARKLSKDSPYLQYDKGYNHAHGDFMAVIKERGL